MAQINKAFIKVYEEEFFDGTITTANDEQMVMAKSSNRVTIDENKHSSV
jgi:hypothetical protein